MWLGHITFGDSIVTINSYLELLNSFLAPMLSELPTNIIFQQDGVSLRYSQAVRDSLDKKCQICRLDEHAPWISQHASFDITPLDFFLQDYVKGVVCKTQCNSLTQLKRRITVCKRKFVLTISHSFLKNFLTVLGTFEIPCTLTLVRETLHWEATFYYETTIVMRDVVIWNRMPGHKNCREFLDRANWVQAGTWRTLLS